MEPITATIVAAIVGGATASLKGVASQAVLDTYNGLKALIVERFKRKATIEVLEEDPQSELSQKLLTEALIKVKATEDPEFIEIAERLSDALSRIPREKAESLGLDIEGFKAGSAELRNIKATGTAVRIRDTEVGGQFIAEGIEGGLSDDKKK